MTRVRSVEFLPEIFQTDVNKQFLAATLDQLIQEPKFKKTQGFIGRSVGPGVNPNDRYVIELNKTRADYQLEAGIISLEPDTNRVRDVMTYPGILDAVQYQGGNSSRPDRLFESQYYTWDPFINWDTFINFSQYFWIPEGPASVDVAATGVPATDEFVVNRANGVYTFSGLAGNNPTIDLVRGGSYNFAVAQNDKETVNYRVSNAGISSYVIDSRNNPALTLMRGNTYVFTMNLDGVYPFYIKTAPTTGLSNIYSSGVTNNGATVGQVIFVVPQDAPDTLFYASATQSNMQGTINVINADAGTGPGFWIQSAPGISGRVPITPNISSRDVFGVTGNGEDLGTITFNVPTKTAQNFFYDLPSIGSVDLITNLKFDQLDNVAVSDFIAEYGGIDGITELNGRTVVFTQPVSDPSLGGWFKTTLYDPLDRDNALNGQPGSYDSLLYSETTEVPFEQRFSIWQIEYVNDDGYVYMTLNSVRAISNLDKFTVRYGNTYASTSWFKNDAGFFREIPLLTAAQDTLYYQDGTDPEIFGRIRLIEQTQGDTLFIDEILGKTAYTSPNGVAFTNGLKVIFRGQVEPVEYINNEYYINGVGTAIELLPVSNYITPETYVVNNLTTATSQTFNITTVPNPDGPGAIYAVNGVDRPVLNFVRGGIYIFNQSDSTNAGHPIAFRDSANNLYSVGVVSIGVPGQPGAQTTITVAENAPNNLRYFCTVHGNSMGNVIIVAMSDSPTSPDYLTINRASQDLNAWSRSNRWFHIDVINATATYNNTEAVIDNALRAKRPVIEFRTGVRMFNMGTQGKQPVNIIDFEETDAFSNIEGSTGYSVGGYTFTEGSRVIFAADLDANVRNKIWIVNFISPDSIGPDFVPQPLINLTLAADGEVLTDQSTVCLDGTALKGVSFWYDGIDWIRAQLKTGVQQAPLFDIYDADGVSFAELVKYPSTTFAGSKLFSYAVSDSGVLDSVLQFPLQYLNLNNVGDIVFENNLYKDSFLYVRDNVSVTELISNGFVQEYQSRTVFQRQIGWNPAVTDTQIRQQFKFTYTGELLKLDVNVQSTNANIPAVQIYVGSAFRDPGSYTVATTANSSTIALNNTYKIGDIVEVLVLSDQISQVAFYQVPINLEKNPINGNSNSFTLGTIRTHYESICENLSTLQGPINGANNTRDLGYIGVYGQIILQQSAPLILAGYFNRSQDYNIFASLQYNSKEYQKFKNLMLQEITRLTIGFETPGEILTQAMENLTTGRIEINPFYWSDMVPTGSVFINNSYTVGLITTNVFDTVQVYNYTSANYRGLLVYQNQQLLTRGFDYVVATDGPRITVTVPLAVGDIVTIEEYPETFGNFVPNTPTKLGLYPAYRPEIVTTKTTSGTAVVIVGHDGSQTPAFGDIRDQVLLEFETRIYNNLKLDQNPVPLLITDVLPGNFRQTGYSYSDINDLLSTDFLSYVGWNKLNYTEQTYLSTNEFSWNYSSSQNKLSFDRLDNTNLLGAWRGINRYFYDTENPALTPWEMLGFSLKPTWWNTVYGPGPYTSNNLVLWDDLEAGRVADPAGTFVLPAYIRPGLTTVIPVDSEGLLASPFATVVSGYNDNSFQKSWAAGDGGPVEASWWNSSAYPFAVMRVLALTRPAKFYSLFADRDLYRYNAEFDQYLYQDRYRLDAKNITVYGDGVSKASYINWIVDYNRQSGTNSTAELQADLGSLDVRLCYRMASFSDKQYIKMYTEKSSPNSLNSTLLIPDESYDLLLYKNQPFDRTTYSSVIVQIVEGGYAVFGYSTAQPFFNISISQGIGRLKSITAGNITVQVPTVYTDTVVQVPYGYVFNNQTSVCDFLLSYGNVLQKQGLTFTDRANGIDLDWNQMAQEFLYWSQQGWEVNSLINLNPLASGLTVSKPQSVVDSVVTQTSENVLLNQNKRELPTKNLNIVRLDNTLTLQPLTSESLSFADLRFTNFEHMIVLNNRSVFGDLIYEPITGARQSRLNLAAVTSTEWNGTVDAQGFILNQDNVQQWTGLKKYSKGEIVKYKDQFWSAATIVDPSTEFKFDQWIKSDYQQLELGLLPNIANKADQLANSYSLNTANLELDNDLLSYGLIGFRQRQYMSALNLDDVSQVNVYQQFLKTKGTILAAELLSQANLGKESADYRIFENWAVQRAVYGANANRSFVELRLNRALLNSNPSLVQVTLPQESSQADQQVLLNNVWRQSYKLTSPDFLPTTTVTVTDTALPTAGYVSLDDVDITTFSIDDLSAIQANLDAVSVGATIWAAKVNNYDWNIYRCAPVPGYIDHVCDNLDGTSICNFTQPHGLAVGNKLIIKFFDVEIDGVYEVLEVSGVNTVNIAYEFDGTQSQINGTGIGFTLQTQRVSQPSDILNLPYVNEIQTGTKVWVDNAGNNQWAVLEKQNQFSSVVELAPALLDATEQYGQSVAQARSRLAALVGSPRYGFASGTATGGIYTYVKNFSGSYQPVSPADNGDAILVLSATGVRGYGNAVDFGNQTWAAAGASLSLGPASQSNVGYAAVIYRDPALGQPGVNPYAQWQLLTPPVSGDRILPGEFGYSVVVSADEHWMYVGSPGVNKVHAYALVDVADQFIRTLGNGVTTTYQIANAIQIDNNLQLEVSVNSNSQTLGVDYQINGFSEVEFLITPPGLVVAGSFVSGTTYTILTIGTTDFTAIGASSNTVGVTFTATGPGAGTGTANNSQVVDIRRRNLRTITNSGTQQLADFLFTVNNIDSFSVLANDVLLRPNIDYTYNNGTGLLTWINAPAGGASIFVRADKHFVYVNTVTVAGLAASARFGHSVSTTTDGRQVLIGCADQTIANAIKTASAAGSAARGTATYSDLIQSSTSGSGYGAVFNVTRNNQAYSITIVKGGQNYNVGDTITISGTLLGGTSSNNLTITISELINFVEAGSVYVFDRNVQRFIYGTETSSVTFSVLGTVTAPVSVIVNTQFLINEIDSTENADGTFTVAGNDITIQDPLQVGDVIEIETNQFTQVQQIVKDTVTEFTNFGQALDICSFNCSLYVGAPQDSTQEWKAGSVQRSVNQSRVYGTITATVANPVLTAGQTLRVNNIDVAVPNAPNNTVVGLAAAINNLVTLGGVPNVTASVSATGFLTISVKNTDSAAPGNKLQVAPGSSTGSTVFGDLGFDTFVFTQNILSPYPVEFAAFGASVNIDDTADNLVIGAPNGSQYFVTEFDEGDTDFDGNSTVFFSTIVQSGVVYTYDYLPSANDSVVNPGKFVFGLQIADSDAGVYNEVTRDYVIDTSVNYGIAVNYTDGVLMVGAPGNDFGDSSAANRGRVFVFENPDRALAWATVGHQQPVVDVRLLNSVFTYDRITSARTEFFDFFDPLQGKILGAAKQNINYIGAVDPAAYNSGPVNNQGNTWTSSRLGEMWWDISTVRFVDPNQDNIVYASRRWGQVFPGSVVDVYQWTESTQPPASYTGPGTPLNVFSFSVNSSLSIDGTFNTFYYFWVRGITTVSTNRGKTLSAETVARYIENPKASGIPYIAAINTSTVAIYNAGTVIEAEDTILSIEFDREFTNNNVHVEYELVPQDKEDGFLTDGLYRKLQDSFCGVDTFGNLVPDPNLNAAEQYGVQFRPRQSMFVNRFEALKNYIVRANTVLARFPVVENRSFVLLNSSDPLPPQAQTYVAGTFERGATYIISSLGTTNFVEIGAASNTIGITFVATGKGSGNGTATLVNWNLQVANLEILSFQNIDPPSIPVGYRYLVTSDSSNNGLWTIYEVQLSQGPVPGLKQLVLVRVQNFDTKRYWNFIDWYQLGYNPSTKVVAEVPNFSTLETLNLPVGSSVLVTANAQGKFEIYLLTDIAWQRVALQDGTIAISAQIYDYALGRFGFDVEVFDAQYFDQEPVIETRKIIQAINEELFVDDLLLERNRSLVLMFNYVLSEFAAPEWLVKTSLIDVDHRIRELAPFQNFRQDNQEFVLDYIQEVKPYHVQIREFNLLYNGQDQYLGSLTDFDVPAYFDTNLAVPQYVSPILLPYDAGTAEADNFNSDAASDALIWQAWPYSQWINNYLLTLDSITIVNSGSAFTDVPTVTIIGDAEVAATAQAVLNSLGEIAFVTVLTSGSGYRATPTIVFEGGNGTGAQAYAVMGNDLVRSFRTVIKYDRYQYQSSISDWQPNGYYEDGTLVRFADQVWRANSPDSTAVSSATFEFDQWTRVPAADLSGVDRTSGYYVAGVNEPGLDLPLLIDGIDYPGVQVFGRQFDSAADLDAVYSSSFQDIYLGTRFSDINIDGGEFIGPYEGHAPEELVNGAEYDTVDIRVYTRPGSDWSLEDNIAGNDGHGFELVSRRYIFDTDRPELNWGGLVENPVSIVVSNATTGIDLVSEVDYITNWVNRTVTILNRVALANLVNITVYELGGGSQLFRQNYRGNNIDDFLIVPVNVNEIYDPVLFVNGINTQVIDWEAFYPAAEWDQLQVYNRLDVVLTTGPTMYYRALQSVPAGIAITNTDYWLNFVPTTQSKILLEQVYTTTDALALTVLGETTPIQYSWSTPQTQNIAVTTAINQTRTVSLTNSLQGTNIPNMIVEVGGVRLRPYEGIEWLGDNTTLSFGLPQRGGYQQSIINAETDIDVYVDNVLQTQSIGDVVGAYSVTNWDGSNTPGRQILFAQAPALGSVVLITVSTVASYLVSGNTLQLVNAPPIGDVVSVTTWNDTAQQNILTLVFQGPQDEGIVITEPYDSTAFDAGTVNDDPGSFDYSEGITIPNNNLDLQRSGLQANRLWVTLNGRRLFDGKDFVVDGDVLVLASGSMQNSDIVAVTEFTESVVPEAIAFRIFQDMRGVQATYRITTSTTTMLTQNLSATANIAHVRDANALTQPNLPDGIFGICTINGERIMYRERDTALNTISGLMRGTAGTAATSHVLGTDVYDIGRGNLLFEEYQDYVDKSVTVGDGSTTVFYSDIDINNPDESSSIDIRAVEVYVGGIKQLPYVDILTADLEIGLSYNISFLGTTNWNNIAGTVGITYAVNDKITVAAIGTGTGTAVQQTTQYRWTEALFNPVAIEFVVNDEVIPPLVAPAAGNDITILVRRGTNWYRSGPNTPSNGIALQETDTRAARFFRGI